MPSLEWVCKPNPHVHFLELKFYTNIKDGITNPVLQRETSYEENNHSKTAEKIAATR